MPRDASGNYTLPAGNPVENDTIIDVNWANPTMADIAVQLNNVFTRDGVLGPTAPFKLVDGSVTAPGLSFTSEPGLGLYREASGTLGVAAANQKLATFASTGVNFLKPTTVSDTFSVTAAAGNPASIRVIGNGGAAGTNGFEFNQNAAGVGLVWNRDNQHILFGVNNVEKMRLTADGKLGLGTDSPLTNFHVKDLGAQIRLESSGVVPGTANAALMSFWDSTGSLGNIGYNGSAELAITNTRATAMRFYNGGTLRLSLGNNGDVIMSSGSQLLVSGDPNFRIQSTVANCFYGIHGTHQYLFRTTDATWIWVRESASHMSLGATGLTLHVGSGVKPGGGPWDAPSDARVKDLVQNYTHGLAELKQLRPTTYTYKPETGYDPRKVHVGLVAQEVAPHMPEMVSSVDDTLVLNTNALTYALINAVKTLDARLVALGG